MENSERKKKGLSGQRKIRRKYQKPEVEKIENPEWGTVSAQCFASPPICAEYTVCE